ncbi:hypothetical protein BKA70DRAFT_450875 [Coprinopsis sp. MPI-PUGE-AT-0042]|nr:hypothetical protein BKA70DRAFT_450875 [Coprinopsis sp. MPI-PUGE-AT-0042]
MPKQAQFAATARLIRNGDIARMECLVANWPPSGNVIEVFDALLPHFSIPGSDRESLVVSDRRSRRARLASSALPLCLESSTPPETSLALSERMVANLSKIVWWQKELHSANHPHHPPSSINGPAIMTFVLRAYHLSDDLGNAILALPSSVALSALAFASGCLTSFFKEAPEEYYPPFLTLVSRFMNDTTSNVLFLDCILECGPSGLNGFVSTIVDIIRFLRVYSFSDFDPIEVSSMLTAYRDILDGLSKDAQYVRALRKHKYISYFLEMHVEPFNRNPVCCGDGAVAYSMDAFRWITTNQPRRARKSLVLEFARNGGFPLLCTLLGSTWRGMRLTRCCGCSLDIHLPDGFETPLNPFWITWQTNCRLT